ncbi:hypothetical protein Ancab_007465 [Ancistrocladus abbreviatus]
MIDCNDEGATYAEAQVVNCTILDFLKKPNLELLPRFLPFDNSDCETEQINELIQVGIQVTTFTCGGIAIGGCFSHKFMDVKSISTFLSSWSTVMRDEKETMDPDFTIGALTFTPMDPEAYVPLKPTLRSTTVLKRLVFDSSSINALKSRAKSESVPNPTRVEAVSSFLWKHLMAVKRKVSDLGSVCDVFGYVINIRNRVKPPLPEGSIGNLIISEFVSYQKKDQEVELSDLVDLVRELASKLKDDCMKNLQGGISEVDFGWGKPMWTAIPYHTDMAVDSFALIDGNNLEGIEAWLNVNEQEMTLLEKDQEFLQFASPNPGIVYQH